jgi:hypothetical protein
LEVNGRTFELVGILAGCGLLIGAFDDRRGASLPTIFTNCW